MIRQKIAKVFGFTLIELLVVVAIIAVLTAVAIPFYQNFTAKGRDSKRLSDLKIIQGLLQRYYSDQKIFPISSDFVTGSALSAGGVTYSSKIPADPSAPGNPDYRYIAQPAGCDNTTSNLECRGYCLYANLEDSNKADTTSSCPDQSGYNFEVTPLTHLAGVLLTPTPSPSKTPTPSPLPLPTATPTGTIAQFGNIVWLKDGGFNGTTWADSSGKGNNAVAGTLPTSGTSAVLNGKSVVRFNGTTQFLSIPDYPSGQEPSTGLSIFMAGGPGINNAGALLSKSAAGGWSAPYVRQLIQGGGSTTLAGYLQDASVVTYQTVVNTNANPFLLALTGGPLGTAFYNKSIINHPNGIKGTALGTITDSTFPTEIGRDLGGEYYLGDLAEVLIYSTGFGAYDRLTVENYLASKYAIPASFNPASIGGLQGWYKADAITGVAGGAALNTWTDSSGNSHDLTGSGHAPIFGTNRLNGKPAVLFASASTQYLNSAAWSIPQPATVFVVGKGTNSSHNLFLDGSTHNQMTIYHTSGTQISTYAGTAGYSSGSLTAANYHLISSTFNGASSKLSVDGMVTAGTVGSSTASGLYVGHYGSDTAVYFDGEIAEILVYTAALTDTQRQQVEGYLSNKYALNGGIRPFDPLAISGLKGWWQVDGGSDVSTNGSAIGTVYDLSGNGRTFIQSTPASRPTYTTGGQNGRAYASFNGSSNFLYGPNITDAKSVFVVGKVRSVSTYGRVLHIAQSDASSAFTGGILVDESAVPNIINTGFPSNFLLGKNWNKSGVEILSSIGTGANVTAYSNGINLGTGTTATGASTASYMTLGARTYGNTSNPDQYSAMDIYEVIIYNTALTDTERQSVEAYLAKKYNVGYKTPNNPSLAGNLVAWYDTSQDSVLADGTAVATWTDRSGNNRNATQATGANQPLYKINILNGRPSLHFDGSNDFLRTSAFALNQPSTVFVVGFAGGASFFVDGAAGSSTLGVYRAAAEFRMNAGTALLGSSANLSGWNIHSAVFNTANSSMYRNGVVSQPPITAGSNNASGLTLGADGTATPVSPLIGDLTEVIVFSGVLPDSDRRAVENYLRQKYNLW